MRRIDRAVASARYACNRATYLFAGGAAACVAYAVRRRELAFSIIATLLFYLPSLRHGSVDAGFLYGGDVLGYHLPAMIKTQSMLSSWHFTGIDVSQFNGSADWFVAPNFFGFHPLIVLYSLLSSPTPTAFQDVGRALVVILAVHTFIACYFSLRLLTRFFAVGFGVAAFAATGFAFSVFMVYAHNQPMFVFCASVVPWAAYGALCFEERRFPWTLLCAALPVLVAFLAGYLPLAAACLGFSVLFVVARLALLGEPPLDVRACIGRLVVAAAPFALALAVVLPYLYAVFSFYRDSPAYGAPSLYFSAYQLADLPQSLLHVFSIHYQVPGPLYEFSIWWGIVPVVICAVFFLSRRAAEHLSIGEWRLLKFASVGYFLVALSIFGEYSVVSDLVYYLVPQVGTMHIYQRFLLPAQLLLTITIGLMLGAVIQARPVIALRVALAILFMAATSVAYLVARHAATAQQLGLDNYAVFDLGLGVLLAMALLMPGQVFAFAVAITLALLPALDQMYNYSTGGNTLEAQRPRHPVVLDEKQRAGVLKYLKRFDDKALIKYVDITPLWKVPGWEVFPKSFPYLNLHELPLSSYGGFSFYLSTRADYMKLAPIGADVRVFPDWEWISNTGADFAVARESDLAGTGVVAARLTQFKDAYHLPGDVVLVPLRGKERDPDVYYDNGYFRVVPFSPGDDTTALDDIALHKPARQSTTSGAEASRAVDGNTSGIFDAGSVTATGNELNAWWEVDLGKVVPIDSVRIWNRTDSATFRLSDYWLFISETPFADNDTAETLRRRAGTWGRINPTPNPQITVKTPGVRGRYVRIQLGGKQPLEEAILSLAEVQVFPSDGKSASSAAKPTVKVLRFETNQANDFKLGVDSTGPATVEYLLWKNPRLHFTVNGKDARVVPRGGLATIDIGPGHSTIEVRYRHWPLMLFWATYAMFFIALAVTGFFALTRERQLWRRTGNTE